jgi:hypothetical protein
MSERHPKEEGQRSHRGRLPFVGSSYTMARFLPFCRTPPPSSEDLLRVRSVPRVRLLWAPIPTLGSNSYTQI